MIELLRFDRQRGERVMGASAAIHPADPILQAYGLGKLDEFSSESVSKHLEGCDSCQQRIAELSSDTFLGRLQHAQVGSDRATSGWSPSAPSSSDGARGPSAVQPPVDTLPPELVEHPDWEIIRELGRGGMGVVYLARNKLMGRLEVLKVVGRYLLERPGVLDRFQREIQSAARLRHANIVTAYSASRIGPNLVLTMEYVEGIDLAKIVKAKGPLPIAHACHFIRQAALGLQHAHERNMVHRDIKPANLIVASDGKKSIVKVLDFGLAKVTSEGQADGGLTREGQMLGTPDFIAPEQIRDAQSADIRADIYSLGCTFYYALSGGPPFRGDHVWDVYQAHFSMDASPLNLVRPEVPMELAAVVAKMMAKEPSRRFQTPGEAAEALTLFSRKGSAGLVGSSSEMSKADQAAPGQTAAGVAPVPPHSGSDAPLVVTEGAKQKAPGLALEGLIDLGERNPLFDTALDGGPEQASPLFRHQWRRDASREVANWSGLKGRGLWATAGVLLFVFVLACFVVIRIRTPNGVIVLENVPEDAVVELDGKQVTITTTAGQKVIGGSAAVVTGTSVQPPSNTPNEHPKAEVTDSTRTVNDEIRHEGGPAPKTPKPLESLKISLGLADEPPVAPAANNARLLDGRTYVTVAGPEAFDMRDCDYTIFARVKTRRGGTIFSKSADGRWVPGGKSLFIREGMLSFDIGWVDCVATERKIDDDNWHDVAITYNHGPHGFVLFVDGKREAEGALEPGKAVEEPVVRIGYTASNFPVPTYFDGQISELRFYQRALADKEIAALVTKDAGGDTAVARWKLDPLSSRVRDETGHRHDGTVEVTPGVAVVAEGGAAVREEPEAKPDNVGQPATPARPADPEEVLRKYGLVIYGEWCILAEEARVFESASQAQRYYMECQLASMEADALLNANEVIPQLEAWVEQYNAEIQNVNWTTGRLHGHARGKHGGGHAGTQMQAHPGLQMYKQALEHQVGQAKRMLANLHKQAFDPEAGPKIVKRIQDTRQKHEQQFTEFERLLDATRQKYKDLFKNREVQYALASLGRRFDTSFQLTASDEFKEFVQWMEGARKNNRRNGRVESRAENKPNGHG
jgi:hypothetical protein